MQSYHKSCESHRDFSSRFLQLDLVETLIIIHHLIYHYVYMNLVEIVSYHLVETVSILTYTCTSSRYVLSYVHTHRDYRMCDYL